MANAGSDSPMATTGDISPTGTPGHSTPKMRKRTKTGCLTCRKRRIKCGEERPTCANCIKSKRQCEGYNQRVVFKPPIGDWPNHPGVVNTMQFHTSMLPGTRNQPFQQPESTTPLPEGPLGSVQSGAMGNFDFSSVDQQVLVGSSGGYAHEQAYQQPLQSPAHQQPLHSPLHQQPLQSPHHHAHMSTSTPSYFPQISPVHTTSPTQFNHESSNHYTTTLQYSQGTSYPPISVAYDSRAESKPSLPQALPHLSIYQQQYPSDSQSEADPAYRTHSSVSPRSDQYPQFTEQRPLMQRYNSHPQMPLLSLPVSSAEMARRGAYNLATATSHSDLSHASYSSLSIPMHDMTPDVKYMPQRVLDQQVVAPQALKHPAQLQLQGFGGDDHVSPTQILDEAAVENEDDDYWDVHSDEDMPDVETGEDDEAALLASREFTNIRNLHFENLNELGIRRYDAFLYDGLLTQYKPEYAASPLRNPKTARVFAHYIHVTGPALSIYERNPRNPTIIFEGATPSAQQGLWTHLLPLKALSHQGLLHAILALASLHIARLQGASTTPSYKHYAYAVKRLLRSLENPRKRLMIPTLATSMLLAHYEVWMAEHSSWSRHLAGAAQLVTEFDFRSLTREARRLRAAQSAQERLYPYQNPEMLIDQRQFEQRLKDSVKTVDESLVSTIAGQMINYDDFGMVLEENGARHETKPRLTGKIDLHSFETLQDLYWAYARQDAYQSIVSGNPLIMAYRKWSDCPPRAPLGRADALYGSHDHLILLIGRIADFVVRDRERKLRQNKSDGGWRPRPGMPGYGSSPVPAGGQDNQPPTPTTPRGPPPHMQMPPSGWSGPPPPGWKGPSPPSFASPQAPNGPETPGQSPPEAPSSSAMPAFYGMAPSRPPAPLTTSYRNPNQESTPSSPNTPHPDYTDLDAAYDSALVEWSAISAAHATVAQTLAGTKSFSPLPDDLCPPAPGGDQNSNMTPFGPALVHRSYDISIIWTLLHMAQVILLRAHPSMPPAMHMAAGVCAQATQPYVMLIGRITSGLQIPLGHNLSPFLGAVLVESTMSLFFAGIQFQDSKQREWLITRLIEIDRRSGWASAGIIARACETAWEKAAGMGRGPPYARRTRRVGEDGALVLDVDSTGNGGGRGHNQQYAAETITGGRGRVADGDDRNVQGGSQSGGGNAGNDTRFIVKTRAPPWAMNLLGTEEDLRASMERVGL